MTQNPPAIQGTPVAPVISVVMSVHNGEKYLREAVESILNQTFRDFEFIIIDDGSTDGSKAILEQYAAKDARVRVVSRENRGLTKSLNEGLALSCGEFIARMDADDVSLPNRFEIQVAFLRNHTEVVALGGLVRYVDANGVPLFIRQLPLEHEEIEKSHCSSWGGFLVHPTVMMRRSAAEAVRGYDEQFSKAQDYDLWFRLGSVGMLANLPCVVLNYRYHAQAITQAGQPEQSHCREKILERELGRRQIAMPLALPLKYQVHMRHDAWLLSAASRSGCIRTAWRCGMRICFIHLRGISRSIYFMGRVFFSKQSRFF